MADARNRPRVVYWNNIPAPYMVDRFNALADRGNIDLEVWFSRRTEPDRSWAVLESTWRFRFRYLPRIGSPDQGIAIPSPLMGRPRPDLLVCLYGAPEFVAGWSAATLLGIRTAFWSEVSFDAWVPRRHYREWLKSRMFRRVDGVLTPGDDGRQFARRYGAAERRIWLVPHRIDAGRFSLGSTLSSAYRSEFRAQHGLTGTVFLYVGRLWRLKGVFDLLEAYDAMRGEVTDSTLVFVGDGKDEAELRARARPLGDQVVFAGFRDIEELPTWYGASDVFVLPTHGDPYALVIDEAMASGLPIVTTSTVGEIRSRVYDGVNGIVVPSGDTRLLSETMSDLAMDPSVVAALGRKSRTIARGWTPMMFAADFERAVDGILTTAGHR